MNPEPATSLNPSKASFFDDENPSVGFYFQNVTPEHLDDLAIPAIVFTQLSRKCDGLTHKGFYSLQGRLLCSYSKDDTSIPPEFILNLTNSQLKMIGFHEATSTYLFIITKNMTKYEFQVESENQYESWITALKHVCVLTSFHEEYKAVKMIGKGSFAKVYLVESKVNGKSFAVKAFTKESLLVSNKTNAKTSMVNEIDIMRCLDHDNIIKLYEVHESERSIYLVLELITGKSLQDVLKRNGLKDNETRTKHMISSIIDALAYLASKGIMHRDLKPDNILIGKDDKVKIVDFGLATYINLPEYIFKKCGTPGYIAPEVFKYDQKNPATHYNDRCDAFSAGCILFYMLFGLLFFDAPNASEILRTNRRFAVDFEPLVAIKEELKKPNSKASKDSLDLVAKLLEFDQKKRISAIEALNHPFIYEIIQQKQSGSYDPYHHVNFSPELIRIRRDSIAEQLKSGAAINSPARFAEKDSLYLDMGKPELNGNIDSITNGSHNNSLLLTRNESTGTSSPNSASVFSKNMPAQRSSFRVQASGNKQNFLKETIIRNMQKNNEPDEESKDDTAVPDCKITELKAERRHSDFVSTKTHYQNIQLIQQREFVPNTNDKGSDEHTSSSSSDSQNDEEMDEKPLHLTGTPTKGVSLTKQMQNPMTPKKNLNRQDDKEKGI